MLEQTRCLLLDELAHHVAEDGANCVEPFVRSANVVESVVVKENLLDDEDSDRLAELRPGLHDAQAEGDDLGGQEEVDNFRRIILHECADHTEGGQTEVFEWSRFGSGVEERIEEERNVGYRAEY